jgi:MFS transporter, AAHS family, 4-hydroxybenzoate transporter
MKRVDVGALLDEGHWSGHQKLLVLATGLAIVLDGLDNQLLPNAVPALIEEWGRPRAEFTNALALGPFGMMLGGLLGGVLGDWLGRRTALLASVWTFAVLTLAVAFASSVEMLGALRFLAGIGLGGALPNAATLASEYVPRSQRPFAITLTIVCIPLGGALAGELAAHLIPAFGWRAPFVVGGVLPIALASGLWKVLPESPHYLVKRRERWPELTEALRRMGHRIPHGTEYVQVRSADSPVKPASVASLFSRTFARDTFALFASFFFCLMVNYVVILLLPVMLTAESVGFSQPSASRMLAISNYGGVVGALLGALLIQRLGSLVTMLGMSAAGVLCAIALAGMRLDPNETLGLMAMLLVTGALLNAVQTTMYALAAHVYPTDIRSTGVGTAVAVGRIGNVLAAYVGALALDRGGPPGYFLCIAALMTVVLLALAAVRRHVPPVVRERTAYVLRVTSE